MAGAAGDETALHRLAAWCLRYAPLVSADWPNGLVLVVAGAAHLYGGEAALAGDLAVRLERGGVEARAGR